MYNLSPQYPATMTQLVMGMQYTNLIFCVSPGFKFSPYPVPRIFPLSGALNVPGSSEQVTIESEHLLSANKLRENRVREAILKLSLNSSSVTILK